MKLFEEFMQADHELDQIIKRLKERITYWFQDGSFSMSSMPVDMATSAPASKRSIILNFADAEFYYQLIVRLYVEDLEYCDVIIKKYDPAKIDEPNGGDPVWTLELTNDKKVKIDDVKEDFIIKKIDDGNSRSENPDENKIEVPKEKQDQQQQGQQPPPGGMPPPGGEMAQMGGGAQMPGAGMPSSPAPMPQAQPGMGGEISL